MDLPTGCHCSYLSVMIVALDSWIYSPGGLTSCIYPAGSSNVNQQPFNHKITHY